MMKMLETATMAAAAAISTVEMEMKTASHLVMYPVTTRNSFNNTTYFEWNEKRIVGTTT